MKKQAIAVSVIVPVYNAQQYLRMCLDSLVKQTLQSLEIVIVDDGSTDGSTTIIQEYLAQYPDKILYLQKKNGGQASARNLGMQQSHGEYLGFLDADDCAKPTMFETLYQVAIEKHADLVECDYDYLDYQTKQAVSKYATVQPRQNVKQMFLDPLVFPWNKLYKKSVVMQSGVLFAEGCIYEDTAFYLQIIPFVKKYAVVQASLIKHYKHEISTMNGTQTKRVGDIFKVLEDVHQFYQTNNLLAQYGTELEYFSSKVLLCSSFRRITWIDDRATRKALLGETWAFLQRVYPDYKRNPYLQISKRKTFMKSFSKPTIYIWCAAFRALKK